jgi:hypothetical protein
VSCQPPIKVIPPVCPDNCSNNGICVNLTKCAELEKENKQKYGNETGLYLLSCGTNANQSKEFNQTGACACFQGFVGLNCALEGRRTLLGLAGLAAGLIALIVIAALLCAALAGGGAVAVSSGVTNPTDGTVINSPLYSANESSGVNPMFGMEEADAYQLH